MVATKFALTDVITLSNDVKMPQLGFGVYASSECATSCLTALRTGYRHIDTAQVYNNESSVGAAVQQSGLPRNSLFITTKILHPHGSVDASYQSALDSVKRIEGEDGSAAVDLFLVHQSSVGSEMRKELWLALERLYLAGKTKSIGVSNYGIGHIDEMKEYATIWPPHVNQLEMHPWCQQREIEKYCRDNGIIIQAFCPLVRNTKADDSTLKAIAKAHGVSTAQVLLRYSLQKGWVPLPKSDTSSYISTNANIYGFQLSRGEMSLLDSLDQGDKGSICCSVSNTL